MLVYTNRLSSRRLLVANSSTPGREEMGASGSIDGEITPDELAAHLEALGAGYAAYGATVRDNAIDGAFLKSFTSKEDIVEALVALEITNVIHQRVLSTKVLAALPSPPMPPAPASPLLSPATPLSAPTIPVPDVITTTQRSLMQQLFAIQGLKVNGVAADEVPGPTPFSTSSSSASVAAADYAVAAQPVLDGSPDSSCSHSTFTGISTTYIPLSVSEHTEEVLQKRINELENRLSKMSNIMREKIPETLDLLLLEEIELALEQGAKDREAFQIQLSSAEGNRQKPNVLDAAGASVGKADG